MHSQQLHSLQLAFESRLGVLNDFWKSQVRRETETETETETERENPPAPMPAPSCMLARYSSPPLVEHTRRCIQLVADLQRYKSFES